MLVSVARKKDLMISDKNQVATLSLHCNETNGVAESTLCDRQKSSVPSSDSTHIKRIDQDKDMHFSAQQ